MAETPRDARRLEEFWSGEFGDAYVERNRAASEGRQPFWNTILSEIDVRSVLEVGCNLGANLRWIAESVPAQHVFGIDINEQALQAVRTQLPGVNAVWSPARDLPFRDRRFDLVFTTGVLIHQAPDILPIVMSEIVRCSKRFVLCGEYHADDPIEVEYRGHSGVLWKRDFGGLYQSLFPELSLRKHGFLDKERGGWDDVTYWLFERSA